MKLKVKLFLVKIVTSYNLLNNAECKLSDTYQFSVSSIIVFIFQQVQFELKTTGITLILKIFILSSLSTITCIVAHVGLHN